MASKSKRKRAEGKKERKAKVVVIHQFGHWTDAALNWRASETPFLEAFLHLAKHGYCVIPNVVAAETVATWKKEVDAVEALFPKSPGLHGIRQWGPFGHLRVQHLVRAHPEVMRVFAHLWTCPESELLTSLDAMCYGYPSKREVKTEVSPRKNAKKKAGGKEVKPRAQKAGWLHGDQAWRRRGKWCIQGQVALTEQSKAKGCLVVLRGSHLAWDEFADSADRFRTGCKSSARSDDWNLLTDAELDRHYPRSTYEQVYVDAPAGSMILWASNTIHQGHVPEAPPAIAAPTDVAPMEVDAGDGKDVKQVLPPPTAEPRQVVYVCQVPRSHLPIGVVDPITKQVAPLTANQFTAYVAKLTTERGKKMVNFLARRMTRHCPSEPRLFGTMPRTYGDATLTAKIKAFVRTVEEKKLGAGPITKRTPDPDPLDTEEEEDEKEPGAEEEEEEEGATPARKKKKTVPKVWPVTLPLALRTALEIAESGETPQHSDDLLPACLAELDSDTKARLWRLNGF